MGLWSGGCDEEEKEFYYQKINSETNYHKNEHETSFTNESLQVGNIAYKNIELEKQNKILSADKENIINELKFIITHLQSNKNYKGETIISELQIIIDTYKS